MVQIGQHDIYNAIKDLGEGVTARDLALETGRALPALYRNLRDLIKNQRVEAEGKPKRYFLT